MFYCSLRLILFHHAGCRGLLALCICSRENDTTFKCYKPASVKSIIRGSPHSKTDFHWGPHTSHQHRHFTHDTAHTNTRFHTRQKWHGLYSTADKWINCAFNDTSMTFGTLFEYTFLVIFGYRAIADLTCDQIGSHFPIWPPPLSIGKRFCLGEMWYIVVFSGFWPAMGSLLRIRWVWTPHSWAFWEIQDGCHFTEMAITSFLFVTDGSFMHISIWFRGQPIHWAYS